MTHFLAVQKDVTFLRKAETHPREWSSVEVALWLDALGLSAKYGEEFLAQKVDGAALLDVADRDGLTRLGVADEGHQSTIIKHITRFREGRKTVLYPTLHEGILALSPPGYESLIKDKNDQQLAVQPEQLQKQFWVTQQERTKADELGIALKYAVKYVQ